jgi:hypothetical protein
MGLRLFGRTVKIEGVSEFEDQLRNPRPALKQRVNTVLTWRCSLSGYVGRLRNESVTCNGRSKTSRLSVEPPGEATLCLPGAMSRRTAFD